MNYESYKCTNVIDLSRSFIIVANDIEKNVNYLCKNDSKKNSK